MKKILSLVLAVLMLASMAVSTSAVYIPGLTTDYITEAPDAPVSMRELLGIYDIISGGNVHSHPGYGGAFPFFGETLYTWWYDDCPICDGFSFHFISKGKINWQCLEPDCGKKGTITGGVPETEDKKEEDKEEDKTDDNDKLFSGVACTNCKSDKTIFIENVLNYFGEVRARYYCAACKEDFHVKTSILDDKTDVADKVTCAHTTCTKEAAFVKLYIEGGKLYARYECSQGHATDKRVFTDSIFDYAKYTVRVTCSRGGSYSILGGGDASYGEVKVIDFTPNKGYVLTDVLVNGMSVDVGGDNRIEVTVKKNTIIRAYFEKVTNLKNFDITASVTGSGSIAAYKNGASVTAAKVTATSADTITYAFSPAKNYTISQVLVNGKSVGAPATYTFSKLDGDKTISVVFAWKNPYTDVKENYKDAVEYVTEAGIMSAVKTASYKSYFYGSAPVTVKNFAAALAEMADVDGKLDDVAERIAWAEKYGIVDESMTLSATCDVQTACKLVRYYLEALESINDVSFEDLNYKDSIKETAIEIGMVTETTYAKNRNLNRYDLASVCYLIAGLEYND